MDIDNLKLAVKSAEMAFEDSKRNLRAEMEKALQPRADQIRAAKIALHVAQDAIGIAALAMRGVVIGETECTHKLSAWNGRPFLGKTVKVRHVYHSMYADGLTVVVSYVKRDGTLSEATANAPIDTLTPAPK